MAERTPNIFKSLSQGSAARKANLAFYKAHGVVGADFSPKIVEFPLVDAGSDNASDRVLSLVGRTRIGRAVVTAAAGAAASFGIAACGGDGSDNSKTFAGEHVTQTALAKNTVDATATPQKVIEVPVTQTATPTTKPTEIPPTPTPEVKGKVLAQADLRAEMVEVYSSAQIPAKACSLKTMSDLFDLFYKNAAATGNPYDVAVGLASLRKEAVGVGKTTQYQQAAGDFSPGFVPIYSAMRSSDIC